VGNTRVAARGLSGSAPRLVIVMSSARANAQSLTWGPRRVRRRSLPGTKTHCPSVGFDRQNCVLEPFGGKVFGRDPILKRSHFPDGPVERHIRPELEQQQAAILHFVSRDLDHFALAQHLMFPRCMPVRQGGHDISANERSTVRIGQSAFGAVDGRDREPSIEHRRQLQVTVWALLRYGHAVCPQVFEERQDFLLHLARQAAIDSRAEGAGLYRPKSSARRIGNLYFQDTESYMAGMRYESATGDGNAEFHTVAEGTPLCSSSSGLWTGFSIAR
jgi:hypothetical protein